jgi:hypothetical protein
MQACHLACHVIRLIWQFQQSGNPLQPHSTPLGLPLACPGLPGLTTQAASLSMLLDLPTTAHTLPLHIGPEALILALYLASKAGNKFASGPASLVSCPHAALGFGLRVLSGALGLAASMRNTPYGAAVLHRATLGFWHVQAVVLGLAITLLRDVFWRRAFLEGVPHLLGPDGERRAREWPLGHQRMVSRCFNIVQALLVLDAALVGGVVWYYS